MVGILETLVKAGAVFGLLALTVRLLRRIDGGGRSRRGRGRAGTGRLRQRGRLLDVVERTGVGRTATVVVVRVASEHWVLGVTDAGITRLGELDLDGDDPDRDGDEHRDGDGTTHGDRDAAAIDLRSVAAPALAWAERVRALRDRLPEREVTEDLSIPTMPDEEPTDGAVQQAPDRPAAVADEVSA